MFEALCLKLQQVLIHIDPVVGVNHNQVREYQITIPKPISEMLEKPSSIKFIITGKKK